MLFPKPLDLAAPADATGRATLLVLDDDHVERLRLLGQLQDHGTCVECENPYQALERAKLTRIDLAVVACDLPFSSLSGLEFVEQLHAIDPTIAVILMSESNTALAAMPSTAGPMVVLPKSGTSPQAMRGFATAAIKQTAENRCPDSRAAE